MEIIFNTSRNAFNRISDSEKRVLETYDLMTILGFSRNSAIIGIAIYKVEKRVIGKTII